MRRARIRRPRWAAEYVEYFDTPINDEIAEGHARMWLNKSLNHELEIRGVQKHSDFQIWHNYINITQPFAYCLTCMDALNYFFPPHFAGGNNLLSIVCGSVLIWGFNWVVLRGVKQAAILNVIGTIGKLVPLLLFCLIMLLAFHWDKFDTNFWGHLLENGKSLGSLPVQPMRGTRCFLSRVLWCFRRIWQAPGICGNWWKTANMPKFLLPGGQQRSLRLLWARRMRGGFCTRLG